MIFAESSFLPAQSVLRSEKNACAYILVVMPVFLLVLLNPCPLVS